MKEYMFWSRKFKKKKCEFLFSKHKGNEFGLSKILRKINFDFGKLE